MARVLLGVMLCAAPLPFGAVYAWAWASLILLTMLAVILWMLGTIQEGRLRLGFSLAPVSPSAAGGFLSARAVA